MKSLDEIHTKELFDTVVENMQMDGYEVEIYENYSGRSMYGRTTIAITAGQFTPSILIGYYFGEAAQQLGFDSVQGDLPTRQDNLGLGTVYY